jgi:hypothetical protein
MSFDPTRIRFKGKLISVAHEYGGSVETPDAEAFSSSLYDEWSHRGEPIEKCADWLRGRLKDCFQSLNEAPAWVEEEPSWPFHNGQPMVFISQTTFGEQEPARSKLSPGETVYVFGARSPEARGFRMIYKVVCQFKEL